MSGAKWGEGLRFAFGTLTVLPVRVSRWDRAAAGRGMVCAPVVGLVIGTAAALTGTVLLVLGADPLLAAVGTVAVPAVLTRGLHLDGLADVADGLGSGRPARDALAVMKQSDIGPFGVLTLVLVLAAQVAALAQLYGTGWAAGAAAALVAAVVARAAMTLASRAGVPAARPQGLGAVVAGSVPVPTAVAAAVLTVLVAAGLAWTESSAEEAAVTGAAAAVLGLCAAEWLLRRCGRRLGGVTGDVFGGLAECAGTACLVVLALVG